MKYLFTSLLLSLFLIQSGWGAEDMSSMVGGVKGGEIQTQNIGTGSGFGYYPENKRQQQQFQEKKKKQSSKAVKKHYH